MTIFAATDDGHADLSAHDTFLSGAPHNTFARLRREDPLSWSEMKGGGGKYYEEISNIFGWT